MLKKNQIIEASSAYREPEVDTGNLIGIPIST